MFDFYYQSGEFSADSGSKLLEFGMDLFVEVAGTFVGAWFAIKLYNRQRMEAIQTQKADKASFNKDKLRYFASLVKSSIHFGTDLSRRCDSVVFALCNDIFSVPEFIITTPDDLVRTVHKLDRESTYHAYREHVKDQKILTLYTDLDTLNRIGDEIMRVWRYYAENENVSRTALMDNLREATSYSTTLMSHGAFDQGGAQLASDLTANSQKFLNADTTHQDPYFFRLEKYLDGVAKISHEFYGSSSQQILIQLRDSSLRGMQLINKYKFDNSNLRLDFTKKVQILEALMNRIELNFQGIKDMFQEDFK